MTVDVLVVDDSESEKDLVVDDSESEKDLVPEKPKTIQESKDALFLLLNIALEKVKVIKELESKLELEKKIKTKKGWLSGWRVDTNMDKVEDFPLPKSITRVCDSKTVFFPEDSVQM